MQTLHPPVASPAPPTPAAAGPKVPLSLADAVFIGLRDNRIVKSAYITRVAEKFDLFVARARFRPTALLTGSAEADFGAGQTGSTINLSPTVSWLLPTGAQFQFSWSRFDTNLGGINQGVNTLSATVSQPLLKGAGLKVNLAPVRIAELQEKINQLALKSTVIETVTSIIGAYRTLLEAQQALALAQEGLTRSAGQLATNKALIDAGRMAAAELVQTQADIATQQVALLEAQQSRNSAQLALLQLLAMDLHTNIVAADSLRANHIGVDLDRAIGLALDDRPDYLSARRALEQARLSLMVAKNDRLWNLSLVGGVQHLSTTGGALVTIDPITGGPITGTGFAGTTGSVGVQLSIPLGDFSLRQQEIQAATGVRTQEVQLEDLRTQIEAEVRDAVQGVELSWRRVEAARQARDLAAQALELERERLAVGRAANFEVLTFETNLRTADAAALSAVIEYLNALTQLDQQLGATLDTWKITLNA